MTWNPATAGYLAHVKVIELAGTFEDMVGRKDLAKHVAVIGILTMLDHLLTYCDIPSARGVFSYCTLLSDSIETNPRTSEAVP